MIIIIIKIYLLLCRIRGFEVTHILNPLFRTLYIEFIIISLCLVLETETNSGGMSSYEFVVNFFLYQNAKGPRVSFTEIKGTECRLNQAQIFAEIAVMNLNSAVL